MRTLFLLCIFLFTGFVTTYASCEKKYSSSASITEKYLGGKIVSKVLYDSNSKTVFATSDDSNVYKVNLLTKSVDKYSTGFSSVATPVATDQNEVVVTNLHGGVVFLSSEKEKIKQNGKSILLSGGVLTPPVALNGSGNHVLVFCQDGGKISCIDTHTKETIGSQKLISSTPDKDSIYCNKSSDDGMYVTTDTGEVYSVSSNCNATQIYKSNSDVRLDHPMYSDTSNNNLFLIDGNSVKSLDSKGGSKTVFTSENPIGFGIEKDPTGDSYFTADKAGFIYKFNETGVNEKVKLPITGVKVIAKPLVTDDFIVQCAEDGYVHFVDKNTMKYVDKLKINGTCRGQPTLLDDGSIAVGTLNGYLSIFNPPKVSSIVDTQTKAPCDMNKEVGALEGNIDNTDLAKTTDASTKSVDSNTQSSSRSQKSSASVGGN